MAERSGAGLSIAFDRNAPSSSSSSRNPRPSASTSQRSLGAFGHDDSDEEQQHRPSSSSNYRSRTEIRSRRSSPSPPPRSQRVIPVSGGSDWREDRRRRIALAAAATVGGNPFNSKNHQTSVGTDQIINAENQRQGLQVRVQTGGRSRLEEEREELERLRLGKTPPLSSAAPSPPHEPAVPLTDDELARNALLSSQGINNNPNANRSIPLQQQISEEEALKADTSSRPDAPTLEDYTATPVEDFGMAILRGMGWREEDSKKDDGGGKGKGEVKKRSALLGLGATEPTSIPGASGIGSGQVNGSGSTKRSDGRGYKPLIRRRKDEADNGDSRSSSDVPTSTRRRSRSPPPRREDERTYSSSDNYGRRRHREDERDSHRHRSDRHRGHHDDESEEEARRRRRRREEERDREDRRRHESSSRRESRR